MKIPKTTIQVECDERVLKGFKIGATHIMYDSIYHHIIHLGWFYIYWTGWPYKESKTI